ncbi:MAG: hypothetical protein M3Z96_10665 [Pseudomonadota bacterium]|nr:hypothetical protein [Pseudomonadota bacterium]
MPKGRPTADLGMFRGMAPGPEGVGRQDHSTWFFVGMLGYRLLSLGHPSANMAGREAAVSRSAGEAGT